MRVPIISGLFWSVVALGSLMWRDSFSGALLLWVPSGIAVAAFRYTKRRHWVQLAAVMLPFQFATIYFSGTPFHAATAYSLSSTLQAVICASLSIVVLGSRTALPRSWRHVAGLFGAAIAGCLAGAIVAIPFRAEQTIAEFAWWFLANVLAILIVTPLLLAVGTAIKQRRYGGRWHFDRQLALALVGCGLLATVALQVSAFSLMPLLVAAMIGMAVRFGQAAISLTLMVYVFVAGVLSIGGESPMPFLPLPRQDAILVMQSWMLTMLATALPIAAMLMKRDELQAELMRHNARMHENLMLLGLAEEIAGIGRWRLDLVTGEQDWSGRMLEMNGLPASLAPDPGDIRDLLPDGGDVLFGEIARQREEREPFSFDYTIKPPDGPERILRISILNEFDEAGIRTAIFGVAIDVTRQVHREQALDLARGRAVRLAAEAQKLANTDALTNLPNRRCTFGRLDTMVDVARKHGSPLAAVIFDIDHFKAINDTHGHQTGDEVIVEVAELARRQARSADLVGRIGGEEFVWLLPGVEAVAARALAERLRSSVERGLKGSLLPDVTISVGLAQFRASDDGDELLARADSALYAAKEGGRNRVRRAA